jgi:hypothetical protein
VTTTTVNTVTETPPYCYQAVGNGPQEVRSQYVLRGNVLSFGFPAGYHRELPLVIDPYLVFSTYSGSFTDNWGFTATYDEAGNLYSGGIEFGNRFPVSTGAFQVNFSGQIDVAVLKYNPEGSQLLYATYVGGGGVEVPHSLIVNKADELVILGTTASTNFPTTAGAYDRQLSRGASADPLSYLYYNQQGNLTTAQGGIRYLNGSDLFVTKLNATGTELLGSTYLGGTANDGLHMVDKPLLLNERNASTTPIINNYGDQFRGDVNVDDAGNIYIASTTTSANFPTVNAAQTTMRGPQDAVVCQFSPDLSALLWSTYLGGSGIDVASSLRIGASGSVYVCGGTTSRDLPVGAGVVKPALNDNQDGFVARLSPTSAAPVLSYLGTAQLDQAYLIDLDGNENVYVMGLTLGQYPVTGNVYRNGNSGQFIHALNNTFTQTLFSTVIGSGRQSPDISPTAFMVSDCGFIYLTGWGRRDQSAIRRAHQQHGGPARNARRVAEHDFRRRLLPGDPVEQRRFAPLRQLYRQPHPAEPRGRGHVPVPERRYHLPRRVRLPRRQRLSHHAQRVVAGQQREFGPEPGRQRRLQQPGFQVCPQHPASRL